MPSRRDFTRSLAAGGAALLAGCGSSDGGGAESGIPGYDPDGDVLTVGAVTRTIPTRVQLNPYSLNPRGERILRPFRQLVLPAHVPTGEYYPSGHSWTVDGASVSVPTTVADYTVEDGAVTYALDDRLTYWDGVPVDARAYVLHRRLLHYAFGDWGETFDGEQVDEWTFRVPLDDGADPGDRKRAVHPGFPRLSPDFTKPWVAEFAAASTEREANDVYRDLDGTIVDFQRLAERGWGSGAYLIESDGDVYNAGVAATLRDDHPGDARIPNLAVRAVSRADLRALVQNGTVDLGTGVVAESGGDYRRGAVPETTTQLGVEPSPLSPGDQVFFDWRSTHVRRLWVRRALVAALPFETVLDNVAGATRAPPAQQSGTLSAAAGHTLGTDFVDSLYAYPTAKDAGTASEWLETAGYSKQGGEWVDPSGDPVTIRVLSSTRGSRTTAQTLVDGLASFGFRVEDARAQTRPENEYASAVREGRYDVTVGRSPAGWTPTDYYGAEPTVRADVPSASPVDVPGNPLDTCGSGDSWASTPATVTVPSDPGALRVEGASYDDGGAAYVHDGGVDVSLCDAVATVTSRGATPAERRAAARRCARWYNYAVPSFVFGQARLGVFANTGDYAAPGASDPATYLADRGSEPTHYHVQAGTVR